MRLPRVGPGPVFVYEWLAVTRRWQLYALRSVFVGCILVAITLVWFGGSVQNVLQADQTVSIANAARIGQMLYGTISTIELSLVLLAAPAATAGSICLDKARGTLDHMLATDLSNAEIVLGKLGVRLIPVLALITCALPVTAIISLLGGIDSSLVIGSFLTMLGSAVLCCSLALILSVFGKKTHEVLMLTYMSIVFWLLSPMLIMLVLSLFLYKYFNNNVGTVLELSRALMYSNPYFLLFSSNWNSGDASITAHLVFLLVTLSISTGLITLATARIRKVALSQAGPAAQPRRRRFAFWKQAKPRMTYARLESLTRRVGPSLDANPVLWREWHRSRPTPMLRIAYLLYTSLGAIWVANAISTSRGRSETSIPITIAIQVSLGLLLLSVSAATSLAEERVRGSLDVLLSTPMSTRSILFGKWWGAFRQIRLPLFWAAVIPLPVIGHVFVFNYLIMLALISAYGAAIASLGLALATWISRLGRAIAVCVSVYLLCSVGFLFFGIFRGNGPSDNLLLLMLGSPPLGTVWAARGLVEAFNPSPRLLGRLVPPALMVWTLFLLLIARLLFVKTVHSFDRHLGRMPDENQPRPCHPPASPDEQQPAIHS